MKVAFLHPDLGIGGAERLIVDAAVGLQEEGHSVTIYTSHCDRTHCFEEVKSGQVNVKVYGDFLPTHLAGRFKIMFAGLRQLVLVLVMIINGEVSQYNYFIVDQLSFCIPILHMFHDYRARILFYCHFPDQKLARHDSLLRSLYRLPFDLYEQFSMSAADSVVVNSAFTKTVYDETFSFIKDSNIPDVIYPCVGLEKEPIDEVTATVLGKLLEGSDYFLSINRFEKKKNIELAINSFALFNANSRSSAKLVVSGGYDYSLDENKEYLKKLEQLAEKSKLKFYTLFKDNYELLTSSTDVPEYDVLFLPSVPSAMKEYLISHTKLLLYTPSFEHFGIVPLEAMKFGAPVLAVNNGGPVESIISLDQSKSLGTGWLEPSDPLVWAKKLDAALALNKETLKINGMKQVQSKFSRKVMTESFERNMLKTLKRPYQKYSWERLTVVWRVGLYAVLKICDFENLFTWAIIAVSFLPASMFQLLVLLLVITSYLIVPDWFSYFGK